HWPPCRCPASMTVGGRYGDLPGVSHSTLRVPVAPCCPVRLSVSSAALLSRRTAMFGNLTRRDFVAGSARAGTLAALGDLAFLEHLTPVSADEARLTQTKVQLNADIEPLVRLIEETPQSKLMEAAAQKVREGTSYQQLLAAV